MKLSEMWHLAAKELKQGKYSYYFHWTDTHCAYGALVHYISGHETCLTCHSVIPPEVRIATRPFMLATQIVTNNDENNWSFEDFAKKAEELGL